MKIIKLISTIIFVLATTALFGQKFITKNGHIRFYSKTPMETIEAHNRQVNCALNVETGDFVFKILMKSFEFEKALMQEHFNENYVESDKYPNAIFKGKITNMEAIDFSKNGKYKATVKGSLIIHGVAKKIVEEGTFTVKDEKVQGYSVFEIKPEDFNINIPNIVVGKIADEMEITVDVNLNLLKK